MCANEQLPNGCVALLTDYGGGSVYVGALKGVLASLAPGVPAIDLFHDVGPQDVREASFLLASQARFFPAGTVFLAVVDPGVGTEREIVLLEALGRRFLAPDNGLLSGVLDTAVSAGGEARAFFAREPRHFLREVSSTFHGRDIFAPLAAALASGRIRPEEVGPAAPLADLRRLPAPSRGPGADGTAEGTVVHVDRFGNLVTDVVPGVGERPRGAALLGREVTAAARTYGEASPGAPFVYTGSFGTVEVAVRDASAARALGAGRGTPVRVLFLESERTP